MCSICRAGEASVLPLAQAGKHCHVDLSFTRLQIDTSTPAGSVSWAANRHCRADLFMPSSLAAAPAESVSWAASRQQPCCPWLKPRSVQGRARSGRRMSGSTSRSASASGELLACLFGSALEDKKSKGGRASELPGAHPPAVIICNTAAAAVHASATVPRCCKLPLTSLLLCRYDREGEPGFASARLWDDGVIRPQVSRIGVCCAAITACNCTAGGGVLDQRLHQQQAGRLF